MASPAHKNNPNKDAVSLLVRISLAPFFGIECWLATPRIDPVRQSKLRGNIKSAAFVLEASMTNPQF